MKLLTTKEYEEIFTRELETNSEIRSEDGRFKVTISEDEIWCQCYNENDTARKDFPPYWFVSNKGNLISVVYGKAYLLVPNTTDDKSYKSYNFFVNRNNVITKKIIQIHNLVGIVFESTAYGKAKKILKSKGIYSFDEINGHHKSGDVRYNSKDDIEFVTIKVHKFIHKVIRNPYKDVDSTSKLLQEFGNLVHDEVPDKISVLVTGERYDRKTGKPIENDKLGDIKETYSLKFTNNALKDLGDIKLLNDSISILLMYKGLDFFEEARYLSFNNGDNIYRCEKKSDRLDIIKITNPVELIDRHFIVCYTNSENYTECDLSDLNL